MPIPEGPESIRHEEQRREGLKQIEGELDQLTDKLNQTPCISEEARKKNDLIQEMICRKKIEWYRMMTDEERVSMFEKKVSDHKAFLNENDEMVYPISMHEIAMDAWGDVPPFLSPKLQAELVRIQQENDFIESDEESDNMS